MMADMADSNPEDPVPWTDDLDGWAGLELPSGVFVTFEPSPDCDCADCMAARREEGVPDAA